MEKTFSFARLSNAIVRRWQVLVIASLFGVALIGAISFILPGRFRAQSTITINYGNTVEPNTLNTQTILLEAIAYSDEVWTPVLSDLELAGWMSAADKQTVFDQVQLPHPMAGEWSFTVSDSNPSRAAVIANAWASSFTGVISKAVGFARQKQHILQTNNAVATELATQEMLCAYLEEERQIVIGTSLDLSALPPRSKCEQGPKQIILSLTTKYAILGMRPSCDDADDTVSDQIQDLEKLENYIEVEHQICRSVVQELHAILEQGGNNAEAISGETLGLRYDLEITSISDAQVPKSTEVPLAQFALTGWFLGFLGGTMWIAWKELRGISENGNE
jgi:capsular polysaccharide biosynthesis protein